MNTFSENRKKVLLPCQVINDQLLAVGTRHPHKNEKFQISVPMAITKLQLH